MIYNHTTCDTVKSWHTKPITIPFTPTDGMEKNLMRDAWNQQTKNSNLYTSDFRHYTLALQLANIKTKWNIILPTVMYQHWLLYLTFSLWSFPTPWRKEIGACSMYPVVRKWFARSRFLLPARFESKAAISSMCTFSGHHLAMPAVFLACLIAEVAEVPSEYEKIWIKGWLGVRRSLGAWMLHR